MALEIDTSNNVGIGTASPGAKLDVKGDLRLEGATSGYLGFKAPATVTTPLTFTLPNGDGSNGQALTTNGTGTLAWTTISGGGASQSTAAAFTFNSNSDSSGSDGGFHFQAAGSDILTLSNSGAMTVAGSSVTGASALAVAAGGTNQILSLNSSGTGAVNMGTGNGTGLSLLDPGAATANYVTVKGAIAGASPLIGTGGSDANIDLTFTPKGTGNSIFSAGNVGIGTTTPAKKLHVFGSSGTNELQVEASAGGTNQANINLVSGTKTWQQFSRESDGNFGIYDGATRFRINPNGGTYIMSLLETGGNVGIGTTSPGQKLSVAGTIESTSGGIKFPDGTTQTSAASVAGNYTLVSNTGTNIGTMTSNGGLAAAFDGTLIKTDTNGAYSTGSGSVGKDFGVGAANSITRWITYGSSNFCYNNSTGNGFAFVSLQYSDDNSSWVTASSFTTNSTCTGTIGEPHDLVVGTTSGHRYWRVYVDGRGGDARISQLQLYTGGGTAVAAALWSANSTNAYYNAGNVGIGSTSPSVSLDVSGGVRSGSSATVTTCGSGQANGEGTQRYNYTTHAMEFCNGTTWIALSGKNVAKAWANFDGTTGTVRSSFNVTSVTRNAQGLYTIVFTTAMTDANYVVTSSNGYKNADNSVTCGVSSSNAAPTTTGFILECSSAQAFIDEPYAMFAIFGN